LKYWNYQYHQELCINDIQSFDCAEGWKSKSDTEKEYFNFCAQHTVGLLQITNAWSSRIDFDTSAQRLQLLGKFFEPDDGA